MHYPAHALTDAVAVLIAEDCKNHKLDDHNSVSSINERSTGVVQILVKGKQYTAVKIVKQQKKINGMEKNQQFSKVLQPFARINMLAEKTHQIVGDDGGNGDNQQQISAVAQEIQPQGHPPGVLDGIYA